MIGLTECQRREHYLAVFTFHENEMFLRLTEWCLHEDPSSRPSSGVVVEELVRIREEARKGSTGETVRRFYQLFIYWKAMGPCMGVSGWPCVGARARPSVGFSGRTWAGVSDQPCVGGIGRPCVGGSVRPSVGFSGRTWEGVSDQPCVGGSGHSCVDGSGQPCVGGSGILCAGGSGVCVCNVIKMAELSHVLRNKTP